MTGETTKTTVRLLVMAFMLTVGQASPKWYLVDTKDVDSAGRLVPP